MKLSRKQVRSLVADLLREAESSIEAVPEIEKTVVIIKEKLSSSGITGSSGLLRQVDNVDEFEDLIRFIFDSAGIDNRQLASVAMSVGKDFLEDPEAAANMSKFNL